MKRNHRQLISVIATFGLLAVMFSLWFKSPVQANELKIKSAAAQHVLCASSNSSFYLAEVKTKFSGAFTGNALYVIATNPFCQSKLTDSVLLSKKVSANASPPLWLLNRSLLI
jgi:hypothetical protein